MGYEWGPYGMMSMRPSWYDGSGCYFGMMSVSPLYMMSVRPFWCDGS